ncbi:F-box/FBD/LRR-repeat protein At1g13570-like [Solanum pennellii]|uniref:F-box/FBD/LRR-repeat protein At1g13570-like n=1 Tax=Solanum pennellii TaxID=28526 RepID=A0ABM1GSI9_SOLPN|nr:F-box/FBD/LRR-repeat protein At1g13570-like [Solanum pennellii]
MPPDEQGLSLPSPDRLSNLNIYLIDDILSRLSFRDVVRVSTLSNDWQYICWRIPHVKFDQTVWKTPEDLTSPTIGFIPILESFLRFHRGIILKVTLNITSLIVCPDVDRLIFSLDTDHLQHFVLKLPFTYPPYRLPNFFFNCSALRHLYLKECEIQLPCFFKGFNKLIRLILKSVMLSSDTFESLISNCPLLEDLVLKDIDNLYPMSINAPKLRSFVFRGDIQLIYLENVPVLSNVLYAPRELVLQDEDDFVNIFSSIPALECFSWDFFEVDNGSTEVIPTRLPSALNCLKRLFMSWINLGEYLELSFSLCIIRSSPNLEEIEIKECILSDGDYFESVPQEVVDEIPASFSDITFNHLRTVKFYDVLLEEVEMQLIKVLLAKSPALVKMVIKPRQMETNKSLNVLAEITKFQRASSKVEVVYLVD